MRYESWLPSLWSGRDGGADPLKHLRTQLDSMFEDWPRPLTSAANHAVVPRVDVSETSVVVSSQSVVRSVRASK